MSDHSPVSLSIVFERPHAMRRGSHIPDRLLSIGELPARLAQIWGDAPSIPDTEGHYMHSEFLATCIRESSFACRHSTLESRREIARRERSLLAPLASVQCPLQLHPGDAHYAGRQAELLDEIRTIQERRSEFFSHLTVARWVALGDRMNKDFFVAYRERPYGTTLRAVLDDTGQLQTHPDRVLETTTAYYEALFSADPSTP